MNRGALIFGGGVVVATSIGTMTYRKLNEPPETNETVQEFKQEGKCVPSRAATITLQDRPPIVLTIDDSDDVQNGPMKSKVTLHLIAKSDEGFAKPVQTVEASSQTTNDMTAGGGTVQGNATTAIPPIAFNFHETGQELEWVAEGDISLSSSGSGTVTAQGRSVDGEIKSNSTLPYTLTVRKDRSATLVVQIGGGQSLTFKGMVLTDYKNAEGMERLMANKSHGMASNESVTPTAGQTPSSGCAQP